MGMGMALIPMGINFYWRLVLMTILFCIETTVSQSTLGTSAQYA